MQASQQTIETKVSRLRAVDGVLERPATQPVQLSLVGSRGFGEPPPLAVQQFEHFVAALQTIADELLKWAAELREAVRDEDAPMVLGSGEDQVRNVPEVSREVVHSAQFMSKDVCDIVTCARGGGLEADRWLARRCHPGHNM